MTLLQHQSITLFKVVKDVMIKTVMQSKYVYVHMIGSKLLTKYSAVDEYSQTIKIQIYTTKDLN